MARIRCVVVSYLCVSLALAADCALAQWYPQQPQQYPQAPQYPQTPQYPQAPSYPGSPQPSVPQGPSVPAMPSSPAPGAIQPGGQTFTDAFGRFRVNFPQGTMPVGAMYNFMNPTAMAQIAIQAVGHDQMFQMSLQNFPNMMRQMGATMDPEQQVNVRGKPARLFSASMRDQSSNTGMRSLNVFISEVNLWIQVMGPEQNAAQLQQTLQAILAGLQF